MNSQELEEIKIRLEKLESLKDKTEMILQVLSFLLRIGGFGLSKEFGKSPPTEVGGL